MDTQERDDCLSVMDIILMALVSRGHINGLPNRALETHAVYGMSIKPQYSCL